MVIIEKPRNSVMVLGDVYFWTATINNWEPLLIKDQFKQIIIDSLSHLTEKKLISVYGFVIMPNHVHVIWEMLDMNGNEKPYASFLKYTAHEFEKQLKSTNPNQLSKFEVSESTRKHRFWQRDPLAIKIIGREMLEQKLDYCHNNPLNEKWNLVTSPEKYFYSSAHDYQDKICRFRFVKHYIERV